MLEVGGSIPSPPTNRYLQLGSSDCLSNLQVVFIWSSGRMQWLQYGHVVPIFAASPCPGLPGRLPSPGTLAEDAPGRVRLPPPQRPAALVRAGGPDRGRPPRRPNAQPLHV